MNIAHILPVNTVSKVKPQQCEMFLAHIVLKYPNVYKNLLAYPNQVRILDNSNYELKKPLPLEALITAAEIVQATDIVIPDELFDYEKTLQKAISFKKSALIYSRYKWMGASQGRSWSEVLACAYELATLDHVSVVCLPKYVSDPEFEGNLFGSKGRIIMADRLRKATDKPIHFLGSKEGTKELFGSDMHHIRSMDTSLWMMYARKGWSLHTERPKDLEADVEFDILSAESAEAMIEDVNTFLNRGCINE